MNREKSLKKFSVRTTNPDSVKKKFDPSNPPQYVAVDETEAIAMFCKDHDIAPAETHHHRFRVSRIPVAEPPAEVKAEAKPEPKVEPKKPEPKAKPEPERKVADLLPSGKGV